MKWSEAFGYSTIGTAVWTDRRGLGDIAGMPGGESSGYLSSSRKWRSYADGGWEYIGGYGFVDSAVSGARIYGWATLRFLCAVNGIQPPKRRLKGEPFLPAPELVVEAVLEQVAKTGPAVDRMGQPDAMPDPEGPGPVPIESMDTRARRFWTRLRALHEERGYPVA